MKVLDNLQHVQKLKNEIAENDKKIKSLESAISRYRDGNQKSLCNIPKDEKKALRIAIRRNKACFELNVKGFIEYCIGETFNCSYEEFLNSGKFEVLK